MHRKTLIAVGVALAMQTYYPPVMAAERSEEEERCPASLSLLSESEREKLPAACRAEDDDNTWAWAVGGVAALSGIALAVHNSNDDSSSSHHTTPLPPDDGGDITPTPPDDNTPVPPDDSDNDVDPPAPPVVFNNNVVWDKAAGTLTIRSTTFTYSENADGTYTLVAADGRSAVVKKWEIDKTANTIQLDGADATGALKWRYDDDGKVYVMKEAGVVVDDPAHSHVIPINNAIITDRGGNTALNGATVLKIIGNDIILNNNGNTVATGEGSVVAAMTGNNITINNNGDLAVAGGTAATVTGDNADVYNRGDSVVTGGGTGAAITGNNAMVDNIGHASVDGENSVYVGVKGDDATIKLEGDLYVSGGAHGIETQGTGALANNEGNITVVDKDSIGMLLEGDKATFINMGDISVSDGITDNHATGVVIKGNDSTFINVGDMSASNAATGVKITGDRGNIALAGAVEVGHDATGLDIAGDNNTLKLATYALDVTGQNATGVNIVGDNNALDITGNMTASGENAVGAKIGGNNTSVTLDGNIQVISEKDASDIYRGGTGVEISGNANAVAITGDVSMVSLNGPDSLLASDDKFAGVSISGSNNHVELDGTLNFNVDDNSTVARQWLNATGLNVEGSDNTVNMTGGINITYAEVPGTDTSAVTGINISGDSTVTLGGHSTLDMATMLGTNAILARVSNGGTMILNDDSVVEVDVDYRDVGYYSYNALLMADGQGSSLDNKGSITSHGVESVMRIFDGAQASNSGKIHIEATGNNEPVLDRTAVVMSLDAGSVARNAAGGDITLISNQIPQGRGGMNDFPLRWYDHVFYSMLAAKNGSVVNDAGATIHLQGAGVHGLSASRGSALNAGDIYLNGFVPTLDDAGNVTSQQYWHPDYLNLTSSGMTSGSSDRGHGEATITNTGNIVVKNAGFGMTALSGSTAINQGTITLEADAGVTKTDENQLVGMAALHGGIVINDTTGTININADYGKPFYTDASSVVINYGTVCLGSNCQDSATYNPTDDAVSDAYTSGVIADSGATVTLNSNTAIMGDVANSGTVSGKAITILDNSTLTNNASGAIDSAITLQQSTLNNAGSLKDVTQSGGIINNSGSVNTFFNSNGGTFNNQQGGTLNYGAKLSNNAIFNNAGTSRLGDNNSARDSSILEINGNAVFNNSGELISDNGNNAIHINQNGTVYNTGLMTLTRSSHDSAINIWGGDGDVINNGTVNATTGAVVTSQSDAGSGKAFFWNQEAGVVNFDHDDASAVKFTNKNFVAHNDGTLNISGNNAVAMSGSQNAQLVNNGTINLGTQGTTDTGMVAMALDSNATADAVIENNGTINIHASDSWAFSVAGAGHVVNNGTVVIDDSVSGSGLIKQGSVTVEGVNGNNGNSSEVHYADYTLPTMPKNSVADTPASAQTNNLSGYVVGTRADGSAGQLKVSNASMNGVGINTGFTAGTADTTVTFDNVVQGSNLTDADAIRSTSVVWNAQGSTDASGNVDVTMSKNAYTDVATDGSVSDVAKALDAGYTSNELYSSLNVGTTAELNSALKQISGSQASTVFREARVLSNRFNMLADAAPQVKDGLAFNLVAKGDPRAELGNDTQYDMLALRQTLDLSANQDLVMEYGIARLDGSGSQKAGDNGLTGGYSQFFGLKHSLAFEDSLAWNNSLRYDVHNLDSSRAVNYGDTRKVANTDSRQQYMEFRSEGAKTFSALNDTLKVTPYAGLKFRHTLEDGYQERSAGDFNLSMNSGRETAVDSVAGLKLDYAGKNGWSATATLEGGPNLSYSKSQRTASLQGAAGQSFGIDDGQKGGGVNGLASVGVKYSSDNTTLNLDAYQWKEDSISDKGLMLNFKKTFR